MPDGHPVGAAALRGGSAHPRVPAGLPPRSDRGRGKGVRRDRLDRQRGIAPHRPVIDTSGRKDGTVVRADLTRDAEKGIHAPPGDTEQTQEPPRPCNARRADPR